MKRVVIFPAMILIILFLANGCIVTSRSSTNTSEIAELKAKIAQLEKQQTDLEERFSGSAEKSAEAYLASETIQQEMGILSGKFEESGHNSAKYTKEMQGLRDYMGSQLSTVDKRLGTIEKKVGIKDAKGLTPVPSSVAAAGLVDNGKKTSPEDLFKEAHNAFKQTNYEMAKAKFRQFIQLYPKNKLADQAQFNIAECFYKQGDFENAILEYDKVTAKYPGSKWTRVAYLNLGFAFMELGSKPDARLFFEKVMADFPGTNEAKVAKKKLEILK